MNKSQLKESLKNSALNATKNAFVLNTFRTILSSENTDRVVIDCAMNFDILTITVRRHHLGYVLCVKEIFDLNVIDNLIFNYYDFMNDNEAHELIEKLSRICTLINNVEKTPSNFFLTMYFD